MADPESLVLLPLWYAVFLLALTCHEAAHAFVAWRGGDSTAYHGGQVTLNPIPHIMREPLGTVVVPLVTYVMFGWTMGWASAPYDPSWERRHPLRASLMAAAGPAANLVLALVGILLLRVGVEAGVWAVDLRSFDQLVAPVAGGAALWDGLGRFCSILFGLNLLLLLFNLVPFPPLDGASILAGLFEPARRLRDQLLSTGIGGFLGLFVAWKTIDFVFLPAFRWMIGTFL